MAGIDVLFELPNDRMYNDDRNLAPFRVETAQNPHCFRFRMVKELEAPTGMEIMIQPDLRVYKQEDWTVYYIGSVRQSWKSAYIRAAHHGKEHNIQLKTSQFPERVGTHTVLNCLQVEHLIAQNGGFVFHTSYINWEGKAILFTAPSGTGKSTQAELWRKYRGTEIINGDRAAVRIVDDTVWAEGIPFSGSSTYCKNVTLPIAAVVYLQQAPVTTICRLHGVEAFLKIWEGCSINTWDKEDMNLVSDAVLKLVEKVPVYKLACTPDETAVIALEQVLRE